MATVTVVNGRAYDSKTNEPLSGVRVKLGKKSATTGGDGTFSIKYTLKEGEPAPTQAIFTKGGYVPKKVPSTTQSGNLKQKINPAALRPLKFDFGIQIPQIIVFGAAQLKGLKGRGASPEGKAIEGALKESNKIYERLIPFALKQLSKFGIEDPNDVEQIDCPAITDISSVITQNNKTTRQLNNSFKTINSLSTAAKVLQGLLQAIKIVLKFLKKNPSPVAKGIPPGPAGGVFPIPLQTTTGQVTSYDEKREKTQKKIERFEELLAVFPDAVSPISLALGQATSIINTTDQAVGNCLNQARTKVIDEINRQQGLSTTTTIGSAIGSGGNSFNSLSLQDLISRGDNYLVTDELGNVFSGSGAINALGRDELFDVTEPNGNSFEIQGGQLGTGVNGDNLQGGQGTGVNGLNTQAGNLSVTDLDFTDIDANLLKDILGIDRSVDIQIGDLLAGNYLQEQLDQELTALTEESAEDGQPSVTEYNGFILSVETETEEQAQGLSIKRRFAVGKNKDGIVLVKGEPSYSSNDQILLDELIFTIESNELTPN